MKKNQINILLALPLLIVFALACNRAGSASADENSGAGKGNSADNTLVGATKSAADCPTRTLSVGEAKNNGLQKYEGCTVSVRGKLWEIQGTTAELFDETERTNYNGSFLVGGDFSDNRWFTVQQRISKMKSDQKYDELPIVTFTGTVKNAGGYSGLKNSTLSELQK